MFIHASGAKYFCLKKSTYVQLSLSLPMAETMTHQVRDLLAAALCGN